VEEESTAGPSTDDVVAPAWNELAWWPRHCSTMPASDVGHAGA
jgi:hypothetical protein